MTVYNFNRGIGWASSGVEYAQAYRATLFRKIGQQARFIFTDNFSENLILMTNKLGFDSTEVIWLYHHFSDMKLAVPSISLEEFLPNFLNGKWTMIQKNENQRILQQSDGVLKMIITLDKVERYYIDSVALYHGDLLIKKDYYSYKKVFSEFFVDGEVSSRVFYNEDNTPALQEYISPESSIYKVGESFYYSKIDLIEHFVTTLKLEKEDVVIIDRSLENAPAILNARVPAKIGIVIHAEHYNVEASDDTYLLWNNHYEYAFNQLAHIDFIITATNTQKQVLQRQLEKKRSHIPTIYAIPVGAIPKLLKGNNRKKNSFITASRLANEKHVDWLVKSFVQIHQKHPDAILDIFGEGGMKKQLLKLIEDNNAESYIHLKGHRKLDLIYPEYDFYLSGSGSEGFGLTLLEAIGAGLPIVGFDVDYGNRNFVSESNGILVHFDKPNEGKNIQSLVNGILEILNKSEESVSQMRNGSYSIAEGYLETEVIDNWKTFFEELQHA